MLTSNATVTYRAPADLKQTEHIEGLPLGTRGGILVHYNFPLDAEYDFKVRARGGGIGVGGQGVKGEELELTLNGERMKLGSGTSLEARVKVKAGPQAVGAAYLKQSPPGADDLWQVYASSSTVSNVVISGPFNPTGLGDTPSRRQIFVCRPAAEGDEETCARKVLTRLAQRAFRQPPSAEDIDTLLAFYRSGRKLGGFDAGIEQGVSRVLADPRFVFRFEREPENVPAGRSYRVSDVELASRLSFFLWSSIPDDELLGFAMANKLHDPVVLEAQTKRMLADDRSEALVTSFGDQWLYLRELKSQRPESKEFTDNLRQSFRRETELLLDSVMREDRSVIDLLNADYTFVDEPLAKFYGIPAFAGAASAGFLCRTMRAADCWARRVSYW